MALIKEPYGLVYNTDGTLCTTYRDDDVPFPGVRSFAVEEATENLLSSDSASFENSVGNWGTNLDATISVSDDYAWIGEKSLKVENTDGDFSEATGSYIQYVRNHMTDDYNYYTISMYVYSPTTIIVRLDNLNFIASNGDISLKEFTIPGGQWKRIWATIYYDEPTAGGLRMGVRSDYAGQTFYIDGAQFEAKPFPTSFVDGSRPNGRLELENTAYVDMNNLVLTGWFKFFDIQRKTIWQRVIEKATGRTGKNGFVLYNTSNIYFDVDGTRISFFDNPETNKWYYIILIFDNGINTARVYDGEAIYEVVITKTVPENENNISLGCAVWSSTQEVIMNGLVSNFFIGKYRKPNGEIIWTDDYIREVYEAKIPFPVQSQLSIY